MQEIIQFNSNQTVIVKEENIGGVLLDFKALQADGTSVAQISDLNKIAVSIKVYRAGKESGVFCDGYLDDILSALSAGTTRYGIATSEKTNGYLVPIGFDGAFMLQKGDHIEIKVKAQNTAFTSLSVPNSDITIETVPATQNNPVVTVVDTVPYVIGEQRINKNLGDNVVKIVLANDFGNDYNLSIEAKPTNGITLSANGFEKTASENLLLAENLNQLQYNPDTDIKHLTVYNEPKVLNNVRLQALFDKAVTANAKILVLRRAYF